jgi:hypothetical protein
MDPNGMLNFSTFFSTRPERSITAWAQPVSSKSADVQLVIVACLAKLAIMVSYDNRLVHGWAVACARKYRARQDNMVIPTMEFRADPAHVRFPVIRLPELAQWTKMEMSFAIVTAAILDRAVNLVPPGMLETR